MTIKDHPRELYQTVARAWLGDAYLRASIEGGTLPDPDNPVPDRVGTTNPDAVTTRWEWDTDLPASKAAAFDDIVEAAQRRIDLTAYAGVKDELAGLRAYYGLASPTNVQSVAAIKGIIKVLRVVIRDV